MHTSYEGIDEEPRPDTAVQFYVFMLLFWPTAILLGVLAYALIPQYDLRLPTLAIALIAGWIGVSVYRARERRKGEAS
jgi:hypothetical protein